MLSVRKSGMSKLVGVTLLALISVTVGVVLYAYVEGRVGNVSSYGVYVKPARIEAVKLYSLKDVLKLFLYVSIDPPQLEYVYVKDTSTGHVYMARPEVVQRIGKDLYLVIVSVPKPLIKSRVIQVALSSGGESLASAPVTIDLRRAPIKALPALYLLDIQGYGSSWVSSEELLRILQPLVGKLISKVVVVSTPTEWENLLNNGPASAIIINCHGEAVPATASIASNADDPSNWVSLFRKIGERVRNGWIWVSVIGYPFYYIVNSTSLYAQNGPGDSGAKVVLGSAIGGYGLFWGYNGEDLLARITDAGAVAANLTGIKLPEVVHASRSLSLGAFPGVAVTPFYINKTGGETYYSAEAIYVGNGAFVLIGFNAFEDAVSANASVAFSIYTYMFRKAPTPLRKVGGTAYVLECLDAQGSWNDPFNAEGITAETALRRMGFNVKNVSSANGVWDVLGAPERNIVIVNTLEEALPIPSELIQSPNTVTYWHVLPNEGVVASLYTYGSAPPSGFINYTSRFTLNDGEVTLYVVPLTISPTSEGNVALQVNYSVNAVRFTDAGIVAYINSGGSVTQRPLNVGFKLLHTYAVTFRFERTSGTLTIQVKDLDTGESDSVTGDGAPSKITLWLGAPPSSPENEATALIKELVINGTYALNSNTLAGKVTISFATSNEATASNLWRTYFEQVTNGAPTSTYPMWRTLLSLIMLRVRQGATVILNSNGYTAYYVSNTAIGRYVIGSSGLSWIAEIMGGSVSVNWNEVRLTLLRHDLPGWLSPTWVANRAQLPTGLTIIGKTYGSTEGYVICYAVKYGSGKVLLGGASNTALPVNLILLDKVYGS